MVDYCEANHIAHGHGFSSPLKPIGVEIKRLVDAGILGQIVSVAVAGMSTGGFFFPPERSVGGRMGATPQGGGDLISRVKNPTASS